MVSYDYRTRIYFVISWAYAINRYLLYHLLLDMSLFFIIFFSLSIHLVIKFMMKIIKNNFNLPMKFFIHLFVLAL